MRALTVRPGVPGHVAVSDVPEPPESDGAVLVAGLEIGICGTDREIVAGGVGEAPAGSDHLVLGHESLGRVLAAPEGSGLAVGDLVAGVVRRPDPVPCASCAVGEWDMCRNGRYTERGIKGLHGYGSERYRLDARFAVPVPGALEAVGVLLEPASVVAKAWDHIDKIGRRTYWEPRTAVVTGAGPIGLLAALLAAQRGLEVHVLDIVADGPKVELTRDLGATYHREPLDATGLVPDVVVECTAVPSVVVDVLRGTGYNGVTCLLGASSAGRAVTLDAGALGRMMVGHNDVVFGSVNANRSHYEQAVAALSRADDDWLRRLITRRVPMERAAEALERRADDVKVVLQVQA